MCKLSARVRSITKPAIPWPPWPSVDAWGGRRSSSGPGHRAVDGRGQLMDEGHRKIDKVLSEAAERLGPDASEAALHEALRALPEDERGELDSFVFSQFMATARFNKAANALKEFHVAGRSRSCPAARRRRASTTRRGVLTKHAGLEPARHGRIRSHRGRGSQV